MKTIKIQPSFIWSLFLAILFIGISISTCYPQDIGVSKKNVFIVADNVGTEMFDMMAPFYLFSSTGEANVYIVAEHRSAIIVKLSFHF
ncbi:MAG: hypothetical protein JJE09_10110 [Bacteroidia bacterium]|nr:hypothetical protein [Bacteroidia bacterium]